MRILLDECMPRLLRKDIAGHEVATVAELGWGGIKNGMLLDIAESKFDVLLTVDRGIEYQQSIRNRQITLVVMDTSTRLPELRPLIPALLKALDSVRPGQVVHISAQTASSSQETG